MIQIEKMNITDVVDKGLCINCGACSTVRKESCITVRLSNGNYYPSISNCIDCGQCLSVCPSGKPIEYRYKDVVLDCDTPHEAFSAHSRDEGIRKHSTSGGVVTSMLLALSQSGRMDHIFSIIEDGTEGQIEYVELKTEDDIRSAAKSKYLNAGIASMIAFMRDHPLDSYAIVAVPCHVDAILKCLEKYSIPREQVSIIGLVCGKSMNYHFLPFIEKFYLKGSSLTHIDYTSKELKGCHCHFMCETETGKSYFDKRIRKKLRVFFKNDRCIYCAEKLNPYADIVCGDVLELPDKYTLGGETGVMVRTRRGKELWEAAAPYLVSEKLDSNRWLTSHNIRALKKYFRYGAAQGLYAGDNPKLSINESVGLNLRILKGKLGKHKKLFGLIRLLTVESKNTEGK